MIAGIAGVSATRARGVVSFTIGHVRGGGKKIHVDDAFVLSRVTTDMPVSQVESIDKWKHLSGLDLSDPDFGTPARVDVLLGADYYGEILRHGRRWGPRGTPFAQKTCFGWVLAGPLRSKGSRRGGNQRQRIGNRAVSAGGMLAPSKGRNDYGTTI